MSVGQREIVDQMQALVDNIEDPGERDLGLVRVAAAVCRRDPARTDALLRRVEQDLSDGEAHSDPNKAARNRSLLRQGARELSLAASKCDPSLAHALQEQQTGQATAARSDVAAALQQIKEGDTKGAARTLRDGIAQGDFAQAKANFWAETYDFSHALLGLRHTQPGQADALYQMEMAKVRAASDLLDVRGLAFLGGYAFTSRGFEAQPDALSFTFVPGESEGLAKLDVLRPGVSITVGRAYLGTAVALLGENFTDTNQLRFADVLGRQLGPLVARYAPDQESALMLDLQEIDEHLPPLGYTVGTPHAPSLEEIEKIPDPALRDGLLLTAAANFWQSEKFDSAEQFGRKIDDTDLRRRVLELVSGGRAMAAVRRHDLDAARRLAGQLPVGLQRELVLCAVAAGYLRMKQMPAARDLLTMVMNDAGQVPVWDRLDADLALESVLPAVDRDAARTLLTQVTNDVNALDAALDDSDSSNLTPAVMARRSERLRDREEPASHAWQAILRSGTISGQFRLELPDLSSLALGDLPRTLALSPADSMVWIASLNSPARQVQVLPGVLTWALKEAGTDSNRPQNLSGQPR